MSQADVLKALTHEWQTTAEICAKISVVKDLHPTGVRSCLARMAKHGEVERIGPDRIGGSSRWRLRT